MEKPPEQPNLEQMLVEKTLKLGVESQEVKDLLQQWTAEKETEAENTNTPRANIELNLSRAKLYKSMGLKDAAIENLEAVCVQAKQENHEDLYNEACNLLDELELENEGE